LIENELHFPDKSGRLRYEGVGIFEGDSIDLVVTQNPDSPPYSTDMEWRNGYYRGDDPENLDDTWLKFGNINVMTKDPRDETLSDEVQATMNGEGTFDFCFYYTGTEDKATVDSFDWSVYDLDTRWGGGLHERFTIDTSQAAFYMVQDKSEVKMWCENEGPDTAASGSKFKYTNEVGEEITNIQGYKPIQCDPGVQTIFHSTTQGSLGDNPTDPESMTTQQLARSIEFRFENTSCWTFKYEHYCPCGNYCDEDGGGDSAMCTNKKWCPASEKDNDTKHNPPNWHDFDSNHPHACKRYTSGNFLFAGTADEKITEKGECITKPPTPAPAPTEEPAYDCLGEIIEDTSITKLDFFNSEVTTNTLHLPDGELRYENVGVVRDQPVDLVVTVTGGEYTDILDVWVEREKDVESMNGLGEDSQFGNINLQTVENKPHSGEGNFKFCFHDHETNELTKVDTFRWSVFDLDERNSDKEKDGIGLKEKMIMDTAQARLYQLWPNPEESEVQMICEDGSAIPCSQGVRTVFHSSTEGVVQDNPTDPNDMTDQQKRRSITFTFKDTDCFEFTYDHYCPVEQNHDKVFPLGYEPEDNIPNKSNDPNYDKTHCRGYSGGNFLFSGDADEIIEEGECITPPPTSAPEPTASPIFIEEANTPPPDPEDDDDDDNVGRECIDDIIIVEIKGVTEYPLSPKKPVIIVDADGRNSVKVDLSQSWTGEESSIGHIFASYKESRFDQVCIETEDPIGGGQIFDEIEIQCNIMSPRAFLEICVADELSNGVLSAGDKATIPECCHPEIPPDHGTVCYILEINCNIECIEESESRRRDRRLLRGKADTLKKGEVG
jgi:hypothetical protein